MYKSNNGYPMLQHGPPHQTLESIRNMYCRPDQQMIGNQQMAMAAQNQQGYPQQIYQRSMPNQSHFNPMIAKYPNSCYSVANTSQTKKRQRGIGYDSNFSSLFDNQPIQDKWQTLRTITNPIANTQIRQNLNPIQVTPSNLADKTSYQKQQLQQSSPGCQSNTRASQLSKSDFYGNMADAFIQKQQQSINSSNKDKYAAGYGHDFNQKKQQFQNQRYQNQNKKKSAQILMSNQINGGKLTKKRKYPDENMIDDSQAASEISVDGKRVFSDDLGNSEHNYSEVKPKKNKKKLKKGWNPGNTDDNNDSCLSDPYGDDNPTGKKKSKRQQKNDQLEEIIERGGSSQDKFESDFIDDDELPNNQNISEGEDDYLSRKKKKKLKKESDKLNNRPQEKQNDSQNDDQNYPNEKEEEEYGISSNEIDEEELQGFMEEWDDQSPKPSKSKSKLNSIKASQLSKVQSHRSHGLSSDNYSKTSRSKQQEKSTFDELLECPNEDELCSDDQEIYNSLSKYVPDARKLKLKFKLRAKNDCVYLPGDFLIPKKTYENLFDHQKQGIQWMYSLWQRQMGGVLGDDMGLGKTVQVAIFLKGLFDSEQIRKVLIVVPATMKVYWEEELLKWTADDFENPSENEEEQLNIMQFDDKKKQNRHAQMKSLRKHGGILITSYGMVSTERLNLTDMRYDVIILDEGHKVKNKATQFRKDITSLRVKGCRLVLTGTPLQNNLNELWSVFDFVQPKIFGSYEKFQIHYGAPIEKGLLKDSSEYEKNTSQYLSKELKLKYQDHFLRRTKKNIFTVISSEYANRPLRISELPLKTDIVIWIPLLETQKQIYQHILQHNQKLVDQIISDGELKNALFILSYIKKLCLHPYLLQTTAIQKKKGIGITSLEEEKILAEQERVQKEQVQNAGIRTRRGNAAKRNQTDFKKNKKQLDNSTEDKENKVNSCNQVNTPVIKLSDSQEAISALLNNIQTHYNKRKIQELIDASSKTQLLFRMMQALRDEGHRVLIFSISKKMLDLLEYIIKNNSDYTERFKYFRIDGDTEISSRELICKQFNTDKSFFCGLLTTKVGGFGLNLTGADRAIIMDPDWNPANDNQAVDRCYRIGQKKDVIVYRLVTIGGIEEMIYRRQVHKKAMNLATIEGSGKSNDHEIGSSQDDIDAEEQSKNGKSAEHNELSDEKAFEKYFNDSDLFKLFMFEDDDDNCQTMKMIHNQNGFNYEKTPTNLAHIKYLQDQDDLIKGITLNSDLYVSKQQLQINDRKLIKGTSSEKINNSQNGFDKIESIQNQKKSPNKVLQDNQDKQSSLQNQQQLRGKLMQIGQQKMSLSNSNNIANQHSISSNLSQFRLQKSTVKNIQQSNFQRQESTNQKSNYQSYQNSNSIFNQAYGYKATRQDRNQTNLDY